MYDASTPIDEVMSDPALGRGARLQFPVNRSYWSGATLGELQLTWYTHIRPATTVAVANYLHDEAASGRQVFYDIYTDEERAAAPALQDTGLFYFKGRPGGRCAMLCAGGGFLYVGAMQDSFPQALELARRGYNALALIYRPGQQAACQDLARAIAFMHEQAAALELNPEGYSLWGGSAGGRMAALLGAEGPQAFGAPALPRAAAVITPYTGFAEYSEHECPTFACVGEDDGIASWRTVKKRLETLEQLGIPTEFHSYPGLGHGFGLGLGTVAEGWLDQAVSFWERQLGS